ncbi:MAG: hypothetical protein LBQ54_07590 [Planctomycetaceae bacterium]|jgi:hypothetical protein|nr:hypothetical protein [Planctomycetaceae bacterium]
MSTTELVKRNQETAVIPAKESKIRSADMPVLRRSVDELAAEQKACELIVNEVLGASAMLVPESLRKDPKALLTLVSYARDLGFSHWEVLQNAFVVSGKVTFNTKFLISVLKERYHMEPRYQWHNGRESVTVTFVDTSRVDEHGDYLPVRDVEFTLTMQEGLQSAQKNSMVWQSQPQKMLAYRAVKMAIDTHWPGILSGADWGEREEYIEFSQAGSFVPRDNGARQIKIVRNVPNAEIQAKLFPASKTVAAPNPPEEKPKKEKPEKTAPPSPTKQEEKKQELSAFELMRNGILACNTASELESLGKQIKVFGETGELIADEISELKDLYREQKSRLS